MATLGNTGEPNSTQEWSGGSLNNQVATALTFPAGGPWRVTSIGLWLAGKDGSASIRGVVWNSARSAVLGSTAAFTAASLAFGVGQNGNYERAFSSSFVVNGGTTVYAGFYRATGDTSQWGRRSGSHYDDSEASASPQPMAGEVLDTGGAIGVYLIYALDNTAPSAPSNVKLEGLASGSLVVGSDNLYLLSLTGNDPSDVLASYDWQIDSTTGSGVVPDWASLAASATGATAGISGQSVSAAITAALTRGTWYALRVRTTDDGGLTGAWSAVYYFKVNSLPTVASRTPGSAALAYIWNIDSDLSVWTAAGSFAKPRFSFVYNDADGQASTQYVIRVYNDNAGVKGTLRTTETVPYVTAAGSTIVHDSVNALVYGTQYWWSVEVVDALGESSGESTATSFKVRFGLAIYEFAAGAGSSAWGFSAPNPVSGYAGFLFASATGASGAGRSAWASDIGAVTPNAYVNVMVRLAPNAAGTNVTLADMTFSYLGSATIPDNWFSSGTVTVALDVSVRRYGTQSLKVVTGATTHYLYAQKTPVSGSSDIDVVPATKYTFSAYVKTNGALTGGVRLAVRKTDGTLLTDSGGASIVTAAVTNTATQPDGWQRLTLTFTVPAGITRIRPSIEYVGTTAGQSYWLDAVKLEEGAVASQWIPGFVGDAVVLDANGVAVDGLAGGIWRLRGSAGTARDTVQLGTNGLIFGGDTEVYSPVSGIIRIESGVQLGADVTLERTAAGIADLTGEIRALGTTAKAFSGKRTADANRRIVIDTDGTISFGDGTAVPDVVLKRLGASRLGVNAGDSIELNSGALLRFVPGASTEVPVVSGVAGQTAVQTVELTEIPANGAIYAEVIAGIRDATGANQNFVLMHFDGSTAGLGYTSGVAGRGGWHTGIMVGLGGTNGRQMKWNTSATTNVTFWLYLAGWWVAV